MRNDSLSIVGLLTSIALTTQLVACSDSSMELPQVNAKSPYSCSEYNDAEVTGRTDVSNRMLTTTMKLIYKEYSGNSPIEVYYKSLSSKISNTTAQYVIKTEEYCLKDSDLELLDAAQLALIDVWNEDMAKSSSAMCWSMNNGIIKPDDAIESLMASHTNYRDKTDLVRKSDQYGSDFLKEKFVDFCVLNPEKFLKSALKESVLAEATQLNNVIEAEEKRLAEEAAKKHQKEEMDKNLKTYTSSVFGESKLKSTTFKMQVKLAEKGSENYEQFLTGVKLSIKDLGKGLPNHKQKAIENLPNELAYDIAQFILDGCRTCTGDYLDNLKMHPKIQEANSEIVNALNELIVQKQSLSESCPPKENCESEAQLKAAKLALSQAKTCEKYFEFGKDVSSTQCFYDPNQFYEYSLLEVTSMDQLSQLSKVDNEIKKKESSFKRDSGKILEDCKYEALDKGYRGDIYKKYLSETCNPRVEQEKQNSIGNLYKKRKELKESFQLTKGKISTYKEKRITTTE
ncbi:MAG: hypothetical protein ACJAW8_001629 [Oleispira sp.]|jgi:hypothetical protein